VALALFYDDERQRIGSHTPALLWPPVTLSLRSLLISDKPEQAQHAHFGNLHLDTWIVDDRYFWGVQGIAKHVVIDSGEAATLDGAKAAAKKKGRDGIDADASRDRPYRR